MCVPRCCVTFLTAGPFHEAGTSWRWLVYLPWCVFVLESCGCSFGFLAYCVRAIFICLFSWLLLFSLEAVETLVRLEGNNSFPTQ